MADKLFIPGPVDVSPDVLERMACPMIGHRSKAYAELHHSTVERLKKVFYTGNTVFLGPCSSTGWMEAAVRNCVSEKSLHVVNGAFSSRWHKIAELNGKNPEKIEVEWGSGAKPGDVEEKLSSGEFEALFVTHNETSTGVMTPLEGFGKVCRDNNVLFCVDAVSSAGGVKIDVDELGIDVLVTGTQKAFAVPPGLAMTVLSEAALKKSETVKNRGLYFDYQDFLKKAVKDNTPSTPPVSLINALCYQLGKILDEEGLENRYARHAKMADYTRSWVKKHWEMLPQDWCASNTVTCAKNTRKTDLAELSKKLLEKGYLFSNGYGKLKGDAFRVAHMGDRTMDELKEYLETIDDIVGL
ncbi:MAG TPA: alanine--glyoxylate aminotransferase family protein [Candidatus Altiarchaeales archaeon]|nr:alanine--glyoxylate aminotransferase family protein [Candidatus Altiarchaeales archaeon]